MKRRIEENAESVKDTINKNVPESKFQNDQQVVDSSSVKLDAGNSSFIPEKKELKGSPLKQDIVSTLVKNVGTSGSNLGDGVTFAGRSVSGDGAATLSTANQTPRADQQRSDSRLGKKLDRNTTKLNFIPNDQYLVEFTESKPLAESVDSDQGYNGTYRNEFARLQKSSGAVPGDLLFDRDVQLISRDELYFGQGQQIEVSGQTGLEDAVTQTVVGIDGNGAPEYGQYEVGQNGNYLTTAVHLTFSDDGSVKEMYFDEIDYTPTVSHTVANKSSASRTILRNDAEVVREVMDVKAGDEKADIWSPLPRAVKQPTRTVGLLRDIEAEVGNEIFAAYRKASSSFAFQLNRAHLDGQDVVGPAISYMRGLGSNLVSADYQNDTWGRNVRDALVPEANTAAAREFYSTGPASLLIAAYDSPSKYTSKADFLVQPRGLRMHLQTADNNIHAFHADRAFVQAFSARETFSTIDHPYDGTLPVCMTDKAGIIHKIRWNDIAAFTSVPRSITAKTSGANITAPVTLLTDVQTSILGAAPVHVVYTTGQSMQQDDIYFDNSTIKIKAGATNDVPFEVIIGDLPAEYADSDSYFVVSSTLESGTALTLHNVNVADPVISTDLVKMYRYNGGPFEYAYSDLRNNYYVTVKHYLFSGLEAYFKDVIGAKIARLLPVEKELTIRTVHSTKYASLWSFILCAATPYIQKERINSMRDVLYYENNVEYPFATTLVALRDATTKSYANYGFVDYDHELTVQQMNPSVSVTWILPEMWQRLNTSTPGETKLLCPWYSNQEDGHFINEDQRDDAAMSYPSTRSGVRSSLLDTVYGMSEKDLRLCYDIVSSFGSLSDGTANAGAYKYGATTDGQIVVTTPISDTLSAHDIIALPRNIGRYMVAPYGVLTPTYDGVYSTDADFDDDLAGTTGYACTYWVGRAVNEHDSSEDAQSILNPVAMNISRASNFVQKWYTILANGMVPTMDCGFVCSLNALNTDNLGMQNFIPFVDANGVTSDAITTRFRSLQKALWTRIQKLPFAISPFDGCHVDRLSANPIMYDPYDMLYWFGLAGFRASDYRESVYNREKEVVNQGMLFLKDPWMTASPIFKEGAVESGVYSGNHFISTK